MSSTILSTKLLSHRQKDMILNAGLRLVEYNAIKIEHQDFELPQDPFDALLFTSQNAVVHFFNNSPFQKSKTIKTFCVGEKTKLLLERHGTKVIATADNAQKLGKIIADKYQKMSFLFLSGKKRLDTLPEILKKNNIRYKEVHVYYTLLVPKQFHGSFDGVLFFSPSAVESYFQENKLEKGIAFCIGSTTEKAAKRHTQKTKVANKPTIENVIVQAIKQLKINSPLEVRTKGM